MVPAKLRILVVLSLWPVHHGLGAHATTKCQVLFDGGITQTVEAADFDKNTSIYDHQFVHGENQTWAEIIQFPHDIPPSLFDATKYTKTFGITINDQSVFLPGGNPPTPQVGFRRSELIPATNNGTDITVRGITTFHWSVRNDPQRPLNFSHEYHPVWHETADFSSSEITFLTGKPFSQSFDPTVNDPRTFRLAGRHLNSGETTFFQTPFTFDVWHNFAVTLGWESNSLTVYYSCGYDPLQRVAGPVFNDNSGGGQFHVGLLKLPTGPSGIDVVHQGFQESNLDEGLLYGGIFIEDSSNECITIF